MMATSSNNVAAVGVSASDFHQWLHAMKMVARLPGGMPPEFRRKLWLALAEQHVQSKPIDWAHEEQRCMSDEPAGDDDEELGIQIVKDLHRTGSSLCSGPSGTVNQGKLKRVLMGYARWNPEVGYCQGFNMLGALILQVMDKDDIESLKVMIFLIEGILPTGYFNGSLGGLQADMAVFRDLLGARLPKLARHLQRLQGPGGDAVLSEPPLTNVFTMQWFLTLFCTCLPINCVLRVWDLVLIEGSDVLLRTALAIWGLLEERILMAKTADDFYCKMGMLSGELLNGHLFDSNGLIQKVVDLGPIPELQKMRDKHLHHVTPWRDKRGLRFFFADDDVDSDEEAASAWSLRLGGVRRGSFGLPTAAGAGSGGVRGPGTQPHQPALDISLLKRQYDKLRERQRQAHIILTSTARQTVAESAASATSALPPVNQYLMGRNAIVSSKGRRLGPAPGSIPPVRKVAKTGPSSGSPASTSASTSKVVTTTAKRNSVPSETLQWKDINASRSNDRLVQAAETLVETPADTETLNPLNKSASTVSNGSSTSDRSATSASYRSSRKRSESSSYSDDSDANSSTSTSLCDEDGGGGGVGSKDSVPSSIENSPMRRADSRSAGDKAPLTSVLSEEDSEVMEMLRTAKLDECISELNKQNLCENCDVLSCEQEGECAVVREEDDEQQEKEMAEEKLVVVIDEQIEEKPNADSEYVITDIVEPMAGIDLESLDKSLEAVESVFPIEARSDALERSQSTEALSQCTTEDNVSAVIASSVVDVSPKPANVPSPLSLESLAIARRTSAESFEKFLQLNFPPPRLVAVIETETATMTSNQTNSPTNPYRYEPFAVKTPSQTPPSSPHNLIRSPSTIASPIVSKHPESAPSFDPPPSSAFAYEYASQPPPSPLTVLSTFAPSPTSEIDHNRLTIASTSATSPLTTTASTTTTTTTPTTTTPTATARLYSQVPAAQSALSPLQPQQPQRPAPLPKSPSPSLLPSAAVASTSQLSPINDFSKYLSSLSSISPQRTPSVGTYLDYSPEMSASPLPADVAKVSPSPAAAPATPAAAPQAQFKVNDEGVTNEYFERVTGAPERPTRLELLSSTSDDACGSGGSFVNDDLTRDIYVNRFVAGQLAKAVTCAIEEKSTAAASAAAAVAAMDDVFAAACKPESVFMNQKSISLDEPRRDDDGVEFKPTSCPEAETIAAPMYAAAQLKQSDRVSRIIEENSRILHSLLLRKSSGVVVEVVSQVVRADECASLEVAGRRASSPLKNIDTIAEHSINEEITNISNDKTVQFDMEVKKVESTAVPTPTKPELEKVESIIEQSPEKPSFQEPEVNGETASIQPPVEIVEPAAQLAPVIKAITPIDLAIPKTMPSLVNEFMSKSLTDVPAALTTISLAEPAGPESLPIRSEPDITETLSSIKNTIRSIDSLCQRDDHVQRSRDKTVEIIESMNECRYRKVNTAGPVVAAATTLDPLDQRSSRMDIRRENSPRRQSRCAEDRDEYQSVCKRDRSSARRLTLGNRTAADLSHFDVDDGAPSNHDRGSSSSRYSFPPGSFAAFEAPAYPSSRSTSPTADRHTTPAPTYPVYTERKLEIRHTTVTSTFYDRFLSQKQEHRRSQLNVRLNSAGGGGVGGGGGGGDRSPNSSGYGLAGCGSGAPNYGGAGGVPSVITQAYLNSLRLPSTKTTSTTTITAELSPPRIRGLSNELSGSLTTFALPSAALSSTASTAMSGVSDRLSAYRSPAQFQSCDNIPHRLGESRSPDHRDRRVNLLGGAQML